MKNFAKWSGISLSYMKYKGSVTSLINQKIRVLKEFYVVDDQNETEVREYLNHYIATHPNQDPHVALDHAASPLIKEKMNRIL